MINNNNNNNNNNGLFNRTMRWLSSVKFFYLQITLITIIRVMCEKNGVIPKKPNRFEITIKLTIYSVV